MNDKYSITSNEVKLFKHLDNLKALQDGRPVPIMCHISLTNKCNKRCVHCCFSGRDKRISLDFETLKSALLQLRELGTRAIEFTGGGEPTLYDKLNETVEFARALGLEIGMNTNALDVSKIASAEAFAWIRVAANVYDDEDFEAHALFEENVKTLQARTKVTSCYIVPKQIGTKNLHKVVGFANRLGVQTRVAPDCIQTREQIKALTNVIIEALDGFPDNKLCFCSDFNVYLFDRPNDVCLVHAIKPLLYTDGWIYNCPSSELAIENHRTMREKFRVCRAEDIRDYYTRDLQVFNHGCSYCKYAKQNEILQAVIQETDDNAFA